MYIKLATLSKYLIKEFVPVIIKDLCLENARHRISVTHSNERKVHDGVSDQRYTFGQNYIRGDVHKNNLNYMIDIKYEKIVIYTYTIALYCGFNFDKIKLQIVRTLVHELRHSYQVEKTMERTIVNEKIKECDAERYADYFMNKYYDQINETILRYEVTEKGA